MKFSENGPMNKSLNFGGDPDHRLDTRIIFRIRHHWEIRKVVNGHLFILLRQMAVQITRAVAKVCTVPVLLVKSGFYAIPGSHYTAVLPLLTVCTFLRRCS